jgi:hypothetical protein
VFVGQNYDEILIVSGRLLFGENFGVSTREGCIRIVQCNVDVYQLTIYSRTEENHGKRLLYWSVSLPYGYVLTSS